MMQQSNAHLTRLNNVVLKNKDEISIGPISDGGSSINFNTGSWRANRPIIDLNKCIHCMMCFLYCPDDSILIKKEGKDGKPEIIGIDLEHCKGCSICASVCPIKCIMMEKEEDAQKKEMKG